MIDLSPNHLATVKAVLAEHVPVCKVRALGSRATWAAKDYSDLDQAIVGEGPLDWGDARPVEGSLRGVQPAHAGGRARLARYLPELPKRD